MNTGIPLLGGRRNLHENSTEEGVEDEEEKEGETAKNKNNNDNGPTSDEQIVDYKR